MKISEDYMRLLGTFLLGILAFIGLRFVLVDNPETHFHANFAIFVDGQKDELKSFAFYEEKQVCSSDEANPSLECTFTIK